MTVSLGRYPCRNRKKALGAGIEWANPTISRKGLDASAAFEISSDSYYRREIDEQIRSIKRPRIDKRSPNLLKRRETEAVLVETSKRSYREEELVYL